MSKLVPVSLRDVPLVERIRAAQEVEREEPGLLPELILAALAPSDNTYLVRAPAVARRTAKAKA